MHDVAVIATLAQAANDTVPATGGTQWWPGTLVPIGVVMAAVIAGYFGGRNARKTPHEKLAALADIYDKLANHPSDFPERFEMLRVAIAHEVDNIEKLRRAAQQGRVAYLKERFRLATSAGGGFASLALFIGFAVFVAIWTSVLEPTVLEWLIGLRSDR